MTKTMILIPARMASSRLPDKPLADIHGQPMIAHVIQRGIEAGLGETIVAVCEQEVADAVTASGGHAVMTDPELPSGSDRIHAALTAIDPDGEAKIIINLQGDLPTLSPSAIAACHNALIETGADIATLAAPINDNEELANPNVVKALVEFEDQNRAALAQDFARQIPKTWNGGHYHHIGIYAYTRSALERFVALPPSHRELEHKLEQLRALDNGMSIAVARVDTVPFGVDTPADLARAQSLLSRA